MRNQPEPTPVASGRHTTVQVPGTDVQVASPRLRLSRGKVTVLAGREGVAEEAQPGMVPRRFMEVHKQNAKRYNLWKQWNGGLGSPSV